MKYTDYLKAITLLALMLSNSFADEQVLAFPGAEGYGRFATGGRGGRVINVTNLDDQGPGSLREAVKQQDPRIIVFKLSGTIALESELRIVCGDLTIAGQSAPGDGICLRNYPLIVDANNVVIRFMRFRLGPESGQHLDALGGRFCSNVIIDHCSASWSVDECVSFYTNTDFTLQWCIISESLNASVHYKGDHGYGGIWGGTRASFHHNLLAHHKSRNPRFSGNSGQGDVPNSNLDYRNNVIYNWLGNSAYGGELGRHNMINNYYKPGPATPDSIKSRIVNPSEPYGKFYVTGNVVDGNQQVSQDNWSSGVQCDDPNAVFAPEPFDAAPVTTSSAKDAYRLVLRYAGASFVRDTVDTRLLGEVRTGTATYQGSITQKPGIIDSPNDVGGWPELTSLPAPQDSDNDGMPNDWEISQDLDPNNPADALGRTLDENYDNIEVYLNSIVDDITAGQFGPAFDFIVDANGTGDFLTLQEAIDAVPDSSQTTTKIFIKSGTYKEKITLPTSKNNITLIGEDLATTILTYDDYASKKDEHGNDIGTSGSSSFFLNGSDVTAENITFENSSGPVGQAVAMRVDGDRVIFRNCHFLGFQDTLYPHGHDSRQYYQNCYIEGTVDFIFGSSTVVFESCDVFCKRGGYITAASTDQGKSFGFVFKNRNIIGDAPQHSFYLGRPWRDYAKVVFMQCYLGTHIKPEGWHNWDEPNRESTAFFAEYKSYGRGSRTADRVPWSHQLTDEQALDYTLENIFSGWDPNQ